MEGCTTFLYPSQQWTASQDVPEDTSKTDGDNKESSNTLLYGGIGIAVLALISLVVVGYRRASTGFDDDEFYGSDDEFPIEKSEPAPEIPEGRPLDEFEDKTINAEPEIIERPGDSLISELSGQDSKESIPEPEEPEAEESVEEDDGISVDEYGTEWWEDENGTWWYREEGAEDWSEFTE